MLGLTFTPSAVASSVDAGPGPTHEECAESQAVAARLLREASAVLRRAQHWPEVDVHDI